MHEDDRLTVFRSNQFVMRYAIGQYYEGTICLLAGGFIQFFGFIEIGKGHKAQGQVPYLPLYKLYFSKRAQDAFRGEWELIDPNAGCIMDGGGDGWCDGQQGKFTQAASAPGSVWIGHFHDY